MTFIKPGRRDKIELVHREQAMDPEPTCEYMEKNIPVKKDERAHIMEKSLFSSFFFLNKSV